MNIVLAMSIFFIVITMIFVAVTLLLPEWMGITGKKAKQIIAAHQEQNPSEVLTTESMKEDTSLKK